MTATMWVFSAAFYMAVFAGLFWTLYGLVAGKGRVILLGVCLGLVGIASLMLGALVSSVAGLVFVTAALTITGLLYRDIRHLVVTSERTGTNR